nr:helix-turn-helix domain-containing protein [uncultured Rhodopila sp.]
MYRRLDRYEDESLGLPYPVVLLDGVEEEIDDETGERVGISIPHLEDLVATVAIARVLRPLQLSGAEVKFIRRVIGRSAKDFAAALHMAPETYSRWENGKQAVGEWADKQVRLAAIVVLREKVARLNADVDAVVNMQIQPSTADELPYLEIRLVHGEGLDNHDREAWDLKLAA